MFKIIEFLKLSHIPPCKGTCLLQDYVQFIFVTYEYVINSSGYTWSFSNITKMVGFCCLSTQAL